MKQSNLITSSGSEELPLLNEEIVEIGRVETGRGLHTFHSLLELSKNKKKKAVYLKSYWKMLFLVAIFYGVPSIQFVVLQYQSSLKGESYCYYNYKCAKSGLGLRAFNNVISNLGYLVFALMYIFHVRLRVPKDKLDEEEITHGLHLDMSLYYSLGWSIFMEGIFSALYHVCPSKIDFQFDTTFMIIGAGLLFISIYQKRQPTVTSGAFRVYSYFAGIISMNVLALLPIPYKFFWLIVFVLMTYVQVVVSLHFYYQDAFSGVTKDLLRKMFTLGKPKDIFRFCFVIIGNCLNFSFAIYFAVNELISGATQDFPGYVLTIMVLDSWLYLFYYGCMKYKNGEKVYIKVWILFVVMVVTGVAAMYFYNIAVTNKFLTPAQSEALNKDCALFDYFDYHDIWHFLSAITVVLSYYVVYFLDEDVATLHRTEIKVF